MPGEHVGFVRIIALGSVVACGITSSVVAQMPETDVHCVPVAERAGRELGCFVIATAPLGKLRGIPQHWYLDGFASKAAAQKAQSPRGTVAEAAGKIWLFTIAPAGWNPGAGERIADIGPLAVGKGDYTAVYMEAIFTPGMKSAVHRHPGPEAWYVIEGEQCLETPKGTIVARAGESAIVPAGPPMQLSAIGSGQRRALVLILHDASQPATIPASDWTPTGACGA